MGFRSKLLVICTILLAISCQKKSGSGSSGNLPEAVVNDSVIPTGGDFIEAKQQKVTEEQISSGVHPITLQWIGWDNPGQATITPDGAGWYQIEGSQANDSHEYLRISGRIRRISERELLLEGFVETRTSYNNGGEPCIKKGQLRFFAKGKRTYYRMQDMENCAGGNLLDYVDIYPGTSTL